MLPKQVTFKGNICPR